MLFSHLGLLALAPQGAEKRDEIKIVPDRNLGDFSAASHRVHSKLLAASLSKKLSALFIRWSISSHKYINCILDRLANLFRRNRFDHSKHLRLDDLGVGKIHEI